MFKENMLIEIGSKSKVREGDQRARPDSEVSERPDCEVKEQRSEKEVRERGQRVK